MTRSENPALASVEHTSAEEPLSGDAASISAVVICYNQAETIRRAVESVLRQTHQDNLSDIIVVDDASSDGSQTVIAELEDLDPRIRVSLRAQNSGGASLPRNDGIKLATGKYVAFLDGDDVWLPQKLERLVPEIKMHPDAAIFYSWCIERDRDSGRQRQVSTRVYKADAGQDQLPEFFVYGGPIYPSTAIIRRDILLKIDGFDPAVRLNEENDLYLRCLRHGPVHCVKDYLVERVTWPGSLGSAQNALENLRWKEVITERMVSLEPRLKRQVPRRDSQISFRRGIVHLEAGHKRNARREFVSSWRKNPFFLRSLIYAALTVLFPNTTETLEKLRASARSLRSGLFR